MDLSELEGGTLTWTQPIRDRRYELRSGDHVLGMLEFASASGSLATVRVVEGAWTMKRTGFLHPRVTVREAGNGEDLAVYEPRLRGDGTVTFTGGRSFPFRPTDFWHQNWAFLDTLEKAVIAFDAGVEGPRLRDAFKVQLTVRLTNVRVYRSETPILVALGLYLAVLRHQDSVTQTSVTG
jgi:hypothetical protein